VVLWAGHTGDHDGDTTSPGLLEITVPEVIDAIDKQLRRRSWPGTGVNGRRTTYRRVG
jgi:hypothetical protein